MTRLSGRERVQLFFESPNRPVLHTAITQFAQILEETQTSDIRYAIDIDPYEC